MIFSRSSINIKKCQKLTKKVCGLFDNSITIEELEKPTMFTLGFLWNQANFLHNLVKKRPSYKGRSGKDYFDGVELSELAYQIAHRLRSNDLVEPLELALTIRLKALLATQSHYHHIIGPAMLELAGVLKKMAAMTKLQINMIVL